MVSVSGKRDFARQRQQRRKGPSHSTNRQQRQSVHTKTHQFGPICTAPGNLCLYETGWWSWKDSNLLPNDYQPPAPKRRFTSLCLSLRNGLSLWNLSNDREVRGLLLRVLCLCRKNPLVPLIALSGVTMIFSSLCEMSCSPRSRATVSHRSINLLG